MRPISNVVDVTNYVMLAVGNPLHAFDYTTLHGGRIVVRRAREGERLRTLDGVERNLTTADLMIADGEHSVALAGIMGGEETEIGESTSTVLLEAANFEPHGLFQTSERLRLRTEGSNRWEKGVDPYLAEPAANFATRLLLELTGATLDRPYRRARRAACASGHRLPARARGCRDRRRHAPGRPATGCSNGSGSTTTARASSCRPGGHAT